MTSLTPPLALNNRFMSSLLVMFKTFKPTFFNTSDWQSDASAFGCKGYVYIVYIILWPRSWTKDRYKVHHHMVYTIFQAMNHGLGKRPSFLLLLMFCLKKIQKDSILFLSEKKEQKQWLSLQISSIKYYWHFVSIDSVFRYIFSLHWCTLHAQTHSVRIVAWWVFPIHKALLWECIITFQILQYTVTFFLVKIFMKTNQGSENFTYFFSNRIFPS